jgi:hypothetical protein
VLQVDIDTKAKIKCVMSALFSHAVLRRVLRHYETPYHEERNHQGKDNLLLFPLRTPAVPGKQEQVRCRELVSVWDIESGRTA